MSDCQISLVIDVREFSICLQSSLVLFAEWTIFAGQSYDTIRAHRALIRLFGDSLSSPLSLHSLLRVSDKPVGAWHGPASTALLIRALFRTDPVKTEPILSQLAVCVARDCAVSLQLVQKLCVGEEESESGR